MYMLTSFATRLSLFLEAGYSESHNADQYFGRYRVRQASLVD